MKIIAVVSQKGGAGKTTTTLNLASELRRRGERVLLVDADPQGSLSVWCEIAQDEGGAPMEVLALTKDLHKGRWVAAARKKGFSVVVIDCPPRLDKATRGALALADLALLPCQPTPPDLHALSHTLDLVEAAQAIRPELKARLLMTRRDTRTALGRRAKRVLEGVGEASPLLRAELTQRTTYPEAHEHGCGVVEFAPRTKAAKEVRALTDEVLGILEES